MININTKLTTSVLLLLLISSCKGGSEEGGSTDSLCLQQYPDTATSQYVLPYKVGDAFRVSQGNCTSHTHNEQYSLEFAYDFAMNIGTEVYAARSGTVTAVREDVADGTTGFDNINYVAIDHGDGTTAYYLHITKNGALVNVGDVILQGQMIALSGNTGTLGTAHLHFHVQEIANNSNGYQTIAVSFRNASPTESHGLREGVVYTALSY